MSKTERRYYDERPLSDGREAALLDQLAGEILDWLAEQAHWRGAVVIGVLGGRGSGKTSLLNILGGKMLKQATRFDLPNADGLPRLLEPDRLDDDADDLIFQIFDHLDPWRVDEDGPGTAKKDPLHLSRRIATRRADPEPFVRLASETATSAAQLPERLVAVQAGLSASFRHLHQEVGKYLAKERSIGEKHDRRLVLLIDDLDLQPHRALELLDLIPRVLDHPGVVLVIAGDERLLAPALQRSLQSQGRDGPGLGRALFDKRVPYLWRLEPWDTWQRFHFLWDGSVGASGKGKGVKPTLDWFWNEDVLDALQEAHRRYHEGATETNAPKTVQEHAKELLEVLLPETPRALKALHNRLAQERYQKGDRLLTVKIRQIQETFSLPPILGHPVRTLFAAVDVAHPQLGLERALAAFPKEVARGLRAFSRPALEATAEQQDPEEDAAKQRDRLLFLRDMQAARRADEDGLLRLLGVNVGAGDFEEVRARNVLTQLARALAQLETLATREAELRFLSISLDADARAVFEPIWRFRVQDEQVLDLRLRPDGQLGRTTIAELAVWLTDAATIKRAEELATRRIKTWVGAKAPLSALLWVGWMLRYIPVEAIFNDHQGNLTRFDLPDRRITYSRAGATNQLRLTESTGANQRSAHAVLLIDLIGKATEAQLAAFEGAPQDARRALLRRGSSEPVKPADLGPLLQDTIEILGRLREEGVTTFHLGLAAPDVYAFALGRQLHAQGEVRVYEWERPSGPYRPVVTLVEAGEQRGEIGQDTDAELRRRLED